MRVKDLKDLRDLKDLKEVSKDDVVELLDELRVIASKGATELLGTGKKNARRAIGAPGEGAVSMALIGGVMLGLMVGALLALVFSPFSSGEARRKLNEQVGKVKERIPSAPGRGSNGEGSYAEETPDTLRSPRTGTPEGTTSV